jgi:hypothetical protein
MSCSIHEGQALSCGEMLSVCPGASATKCARSSAVSSHSLMGWVGIVIINHDHLKAHVALAVWLQEDAPTIPLSALSKLM